MARRPAPSPRDASASRAGTIRRVEPYDHDTYRQRRKARHALVCDDCGVVHHAGRWYWGAPPTGPVEGGLCPACARIRDDYPAGTVELNGIPDRLREEIKQMIDNVAAHEREEHPLERLMETADLGPDLVVTTTGMHLARCIAGALRRRFHSGVVIQYPDPEGLLRVVWNG